MSAMKEKIEKMITQYEDKIAICEHAIDGDCWAGDPGIGLKMEFSREVVKGLKDIIASEEE